jgi:hypothetical protein
MKVVYEPFLYIRRYFLRVLVGRTRRRIRTIGVATLDAPC